MGFAIIEFVMDYGIFKSTRAGDSTHFTLTDAGHNLKWSTIVLIASPFTVPLIPVAILAGLVYVGYKVVRGMVPFVQTIVSAFKASGGNYDLDTDNPEL
jgi:hypothetical protein